MKRLYLRSLHWFPEYDVMEQSQVKPSHCCMQTPWLAHESSWQVVLGPNNAQEEGEWRRKRKKCPKLVRFKEINWFFHSHAPKHSKTQPPKMSTQYMQQDFNIYKRWQKYIFRHKLATITHRRERAEHIVLL
jgi:hypothetical protein